MQGKYWTRTESDFVAKRSEHSTRHANTGQERSLIETDSVEVVCLVCVIGNGRLSVKAMMEVFELKGRDKFLNLYLNLAIQHGFVTMLYPNKPRQKHLLTVKGMAL